MNIHKLKKYIIFIGIFILSVQNIFCQISSLDPTMTIRTDETTRIHPDAEPYLEQIKAGCYKHLSLYNDAASLIDFENGEVTPESIDAFRKLFHSNARVFNDLMKYGQVITIDEYVGLIAKNLRKVGSKFDLRDLKLLSVENNPAIPGLYFEVKILVNKAIYNQIDEKTGLIVDYPDGKEEVMSLDFTLIIQGDELEDVKIYGILGKIIPKPKPYLQEMNASIAYGFNTNSTYSFHEQFGPGFLPIVRSTFMTDIGLLYARSFKRGKHQKWVAGFNYGLHRWNIETDNALQDRIYRSSSGGANNSLLFTESYDYRNVTNIITFNYLQGLFGVHLPIRPILGYKLEYWMDAYIMPTIVFKKEKVNENREIISLDEVGYKDVFEEYCNVKYEGGFTGIEQMTNTFPIGFQLKPNIRYYLTNNKSIALNLGAGYVYYIQSWFKNGSSSIHSLTESGYKSIFIQEFKPAFIRLEAGLFFKL